MTNISLPHNEADRLETLRDYQILDTPPAAAFERIACLATRLFAVPIALVAFLDAERQWVKTCVGAEVAQMPRASSFCAHTIQEEQVMVVADATADPRFASNEWVTGPHRVRFYAGAPLRTPNGHNLGALCVIDVKPRSFGDEEKQLLQDLAAMIVDEMELRRVARELREREFALAQIVQSNNQLAVAVNSLTSGVVITDPHQPDSPIIFANPGFYDTTLYSEAEVIGFNCRFLQGPDTDPEDVKAIREAIAARQPFSRVLLNYRKDGTPFMNELIINPVFDDAGELLSFVGLQNDVTERVQSKRLLENRVQQRTTELRESQIEILTRLARAAEFRDDDTGQHTQRVARTSALLAQALGLSHEQVELIQQAAPLHDVGKISISDLILLKPDKLTDEEFTIMKSHAAAGAALLSDGHSDVVRVAELIAGSHHERWDGRGYPQQLAGEAIPLEARILTVADVFDALTHARPYKKAWPVADAVAEIQRQSGHQFDPDIVQAFLTLSHHELL